MEREAKSCWQVANVVLHGLHLCVILFCVVGWAFPALRVLHLVVCGLTLFSWFVIGPMIGNPGFCFLTGAQHLVWGKQGRRDSGNYMSFLYGRLRGRDPSPVEIRAIDWITQGVLYACTLISFVLVL
ncbi:MAG: hypothetical protein ACI8QS_003247 [Planctomycetota bacterium]|jgi:hypothetical protein